MNYSKMYPLLLVVLFCLLAPQPNRAQSSDKADKKKSSIKAYDEIVTPTTVSDDGLFNVHREDEKFYYEIPFSMLDKEMLWVSRISKVAEGVGGGFVNAGTKTNEQVVRWTRVRNSIHLKSISYNNVANDSLPIYNSVRYNNYEPIISSFKIQAFNPDSTTLVIEVTDLFLSDVRAISGLSERVRKRHSVKSLDKKRSFINRISSYPKNVEVRHDMTFTANEPPSNSRTATISIEMSQSMYLLPEEPMQSRLYDKRVGWFTIRQVDYGSEELKADEKRYIRRWKLIPKDKEAYARGELVEPEKPIIYYLDPATPKKWVPYFKDAIEDWQIAFEVAGFKNAILAREAPSKEEDPDWSPEDARYSTVRYVASTTRNAIGPSVTDPRSGEIIESDIIWYHNHLRSYRNRYLLETGAANPGARTLNTSEAEIGEMIRRVISHEVGHAIGLPHNMKASYSYPTDSLRSASFTQKWGLAATIMDYTRYNYVAQPGDEGVRWVRMLGPYDNYAVNWGYRYIPGADSPEAERTTLNGWINEKNGDPMYLFGGGNRFDPSSQTESVGDDPILASTYGLSNLKIVAPNLAEWTATDGKGYEDLEELYGELVGVWSRFAGHVVANIGGVYEKFKTTDQPGATYTHLERSEQVRAMRFLNQNVFSTPDWLLQKTIIENIGPVGVVDRVRGMQVRQLNNLLRKDRLTRMIENEAFNGTSSYTLTTMLKELRAGLWSELETRAGIDVFRRNLQRAHVEALGKLIEEDKEEWSDITSAARSELRSIQSAAKSAASKYREGIMRSHLEDVVAKVDDTLEADKSE